MRWNESSFQVAIAAALTMILGANVLPGQDPKQPTGPISIEEAVSFAVKNYPAIRAATEREAAARAGVDLQRTRYLPRLDSLWQSNRATRNNIFGLTFPQSVIPSLTGPVLATANNDSVWGSAAGLLFSWEPVDFGYRSATVQAARAAERRTGAEEGFTRLEIAAAAGDAYLTLLAAQELVRAAGADVERRQVFGDTVHVLTKNELRPGVDASRADAELAAARIGLIRAQEQERTNREALAAALGMAGSKLEIAAGPLLNSIPTEVLPNLESSRHPLAEAHKAGIDEAKAQLRAESRSYVPRLNIQSSLSGRGSGANTDGTVDSGLHGLGLERANWAVGFTVTFPIFDFAAARARKQTAAANERAEAARYDQTVQEITDEVEKARAAWESSRLIAENTPIQLKAAQATEVQAQARYKAGLGTVVEVADAQKLLVQAEIDDSLARLTIWRNLFRLAVAQGDVQPFFQILSAQVRGGN